MSEQYREIVKEKKEIKINQMLFSKDENTGKMVRRLPDYVEDYVRQLKKSANTRYTYTQRINTFFDYLISFEDKISAENKSQITTTDIGNLKAKDIKRFLDQVGSRDEDGFRTRANYRAAISSFLEYLSFEELIEYNVVTKIPKEQKTSGKGIIRLDTDQEARFLDTAITGNNLTPKQNKAHQNTGLRDYAICLTLVRTGLRVSELVGLDIGDIDMKKKAFYVIRKRNKADIVYFDDDVAEALIEYLGVRLSPTHSKEPVFTVTIGKYKGERISTRSVQKLVKKYAMAGAEGIGNKITPHKLRATFATNMLQETGNVALVKEELGHENIGTTSKYLDTATQAKENARNILKNRRERLRINDDDGAEIYNKGEK